MLSKAKRAKLLLLPKAPKLYRHNSQKTIVGGLRPHPHPPHIPLNYLQLLKVGFSVPLQKQACSAFREGLWLVFQLFHALVVSCAFSWLCS